MITLEFPTLTVLDNDISIGGGQFPSAWSIEEICANNSTYYLRWSNGVAGAKTLNIDVEENGKDIVVKSGVSSPSPVTHTPQVVRGRPNDRR